MHGQEKSPPPAARPAESARVANQRRSCSAKRIARIRPRCRPLKRRSSSRRQVYHKQQPQAEGEEQGQRLAPMRIQGQQGLPRLRHATRKSMPATTTPTGKAHSHSARAR